MATPVNDRDVLILAGQRELDPRAGKYINLDAVPAMFHVSAEGNPSVNSITITALPINLSGPVTWSTGSGYTLTGTADNVRTLTFTNLTADYVEVPVSITQDGQVYTNKIGISKVQDGAAGTSTPGTPGDKYATAVLYQWSAAASVSAPTGTTTFTWASNANTSYIGSDGWYISPPANPGTSGVKLWVASRPITATGATTTSTVAYNTNTTLYALSQNGANGLPGVKSATARAYQWATGPAPTATGTATYTYSTNDYNNLPATGWTKTKGTAPALGYTLYEASVTVIDSTGATTSALDWGTAAIVGIGYIGTNGQPGVTGDSAAFAYVLVDGNSLNVTPSTKQENGKTKPTTGTWGETRAWVDTPPTPSANQAVFQSNGTYNSTLNQTTWSVPYLSNLRVGSLSAITANLGAITAGSININNKASIDVTGNAVFKSIDIQTAGGVSILSSGGVLNPAFAAPGTLNSSVAVGGNLCYNADFSNGLSGWTKTSDGNNCSVDYCNASHLGGAGFEWTPNGGVGEGSTALHVHQTGTTQGAYFEYLSDPIPVVAGLRYCVSAYTGSHRCNTDVFMYLYDSSGAQLSPSNFGANLDLNTGTFSGGRLLSNYKRHAQFGVMPANACAVRVALRKFPTIVDANNYTDSWSFICRVQVEEAAADVTKPGVWSASGVGTNAYNSINSKLNNGADILKGVLDVNTTYAAGLRVGSLTWGTNGVRTGGYGVAVTPYGLVGYKSDGTQTFSINAATGDAYFNGTLGANIVKANNVDTRGLDIKDLAGNVVFSSGLTLAQQARTNPNLCPSPKGFAEASKFSGASTGRSGDTRFGDGQYAYLPISPDSRYVAVESPPLGIPTNSYYVVSFDAYTEGIPRVLNADIYNGTDYDSTGITPTVTNVLTHYSFTEQMSNSGNAAASRLRLFTAAAGGSPIVISNIKVELGITPTPWCNSVIGPDNASTFIQNTSIKLAHIDTATIGSLSVVSQTVGMLRTATSGPRIEISDNLIEGFGVGGVRRFRLSAT